MYLNYSFICIVAARCGLQTSYSLVTLVPHTCILACSIMYLIDDYLNLSGKK